MIGNLSTIGTSTPLISANSPVSSIIVLIELVDFWKYADVLTVKEDLYFFKYPTSMLFEYVGFKYGFPLQISIGLILVGKGFTNLDQGLLILLL